MLSEKKVKDYFKGKGTVVNWWNPTKGEYSYLYKHQLKIIKKWLSKEYLGDCLEISCGKGRATKELAPLFKNYLATDIAEEMILIAKKECPNIKFEKQDAENLKIKSNSKDCIICLESIVHYPNPQKALNEFYRVLKPQGILIIDYDNKKSIRRIIKNIYKIIERNSKQFGEEIFTPYSKKEFLSMVNLSGLNVEKFKYLGVISPISVHTKSNRKINILGSKASRLLNFLNLDNLPLINRLATYHLILARKNEKQ